MPSKSGAGGGVTAGNGGGGDGAGSAGPVKEPPTRARWTATSWTYDKQMKLANQVVASAWYSKGKQNASEASIVVAAALNALGEEFLDRNQAPVSASACRAQLSKLISEYEARAKDRETGTGGGSDNLDQTDHHQRLDTVSGLVPGWWMLNRYLLRAPQLSFDFLGLTD